MDAVATLSRFAGQLVTVLLLGGATERTNPDQQRKDQVGTSYHSQKKGWPWPVLFSLRFFTSTMTPARKRRQCPSLYEQGFAADYKTVYSVERILVDQPGVASGTRLSSVLHAYLSSLTANFPEFFDLFRLVVHNTNFPRPRLFRTLQAIVNEYSSLASVVAHVQRRAHAFPPVTQRDDLESLVEIVEQLRARK
ncbi:hypothetical protein TYRP_020152 [Tyrophagus putrescentiae]|nr:hypothetical protein TYRP_020152 [Tyrophagus putrescentiae]